MNFKVVQGKKNQVRISVETGANEAWCSCSRKEEDGGDTVSVTLT